jgi:RsiW-degrading membrane proteinase PrsW (M82 family)
MDLLKLVPAALIAVGIPIAFLILIYTLDLYASRTFRLVVLCFAWGTGGGVAIAYLINRYITLRVIDRFELDYVLLYVLFAPLVEEIVKSVPFLYIARDPEFTYFVDGAIYGFASGIGFSITENFIYINQNSEIALPLAMVRAFSTCLMHGTATALIGAALGRLSLERDAPRRLLTTVAAALAIGIHAFFNGVALVAQQVNLPSPLGQSLGVILALLIGLGGVAVIVKFILLGLRKQQQWLAESLDQRMVDLLNADLSLEEREWLAEVLDQESGVTVEELRASQAYGMIDDILAPIAKQFPRRAEEIERIVLQQAQITIKRRLQEEMEDADEKERIQFEILRLEKDTQQLRREAGSSAATYLKCVFDENSDQLGDCLRQISTLSELV